MYIHRQLREEGCLFWCLFLSPRYPHRQFNQAFRLQTHGPGLLLSSTELGQRYSLQPVDHSADRMSHVFWRACDTPSPSCPAPRPHKKSQALDTLLPPSHVFTKSNNPLPSPPRPVLSRTSKLFCDFLGDLEISFAAKGYFQESSACSTSKFNK